jgi:glycosyltransferase involved in cell wall biosynthesis
MRIGFLGNANNYPFMLARAMRRLGHDVQFIVAGSTPLDRPETRYADIGIPYPDWVHDINLSRFDLLVPTARRARVVNILNGCDGIVLNQLAPTLGRFLRKPTIVLLTGSDLNIYCDSSASAKLAAVSPRPPWLLRYPLRKALIAELIKRQREGVRAAKAVNYFPRGIEPVGDALLDEIGVRDAHRLSFMMTEGDELALWPPPNNSPLRIFNGARFNWVRPIPSGCCELDYKGSDIMIRGLASFFRETGIRLDIRFVKKGMHVDESIRLISTLGLSEQVTWCEELSQIGFLDECRKADIVFEQLGQSCVGMAGLDGMAIGRPVIANGRPEIFESIHGVKSPICQSATPEQVVQQLKRLVQDPIERLRVGIASREYVTTYFSVEHAAIQVLARLTSG